MKKKTDWSDKKEVLKAVQFDGMLLKNASNNLRDDKELVLAAVNSVGSALKYASDNLKSDKELVLLAINKSSKEITFIPDSLKDDKDILDAINLRKRIKNIRKCLDEIDGDVFSVRYDPVQDFDEKYNYYLKAL